MSWQIQSGVNDGYPYNTENPVFAPAFSAPYPLGMMCVDGVTNDGYPYHLAIWAARAEQSGIYRLYYGAKRVSRLYYGNRRICASYCRGSLVFRES